MPKISKTLKTKTTVPKKKSPVVKSKVAAVKPKKVVKKIVKKTAENKKAIKKTKTSVSKKPALKKTTTPVKAKSNKVIVDVISDDELFRDVPSAKEAAAVFSSWPDFNKRTEEPVAETPSNEAEAPGENLNSERVEAEQVKPAEEIALGGGEEYDKQKKFFSDWATHIAPAEGEEKPTLAPKKSVGLYRRQAFFYLGATLVLLAAVFYLFFARLTVLVSPQGETINDSLTLNISGSEASSSPDIAATSTVSSNKTIDGQVKVVEVTAEKTFQASGGAVLGSEVVGNVTLTNKSAKAQPLVVNTRLLSADGKLFRLKEAVNVPASGTAVASVYADKPSPDMAVDTPIRFTIPGLWAGLQTQIYAENDGPLVYQTQVAKNIAQSDLTQAESVIKETLDIQAKNEFAATSSDMYTLVGDTGEPMITSFDAKVGDAKSEFTVTAKKKVAVISFSKDKAATLAQARLSLLVPDDKQLLNFNRGQITYTLDSFDLNTNTAVVKAYFGGTMSLKSDSSLISNKKLVGLNKRQISQYLDSFPEIKSYELKFTPPFITTAPILPDLIQIKIQ